MMTIIDDGAQPLPLKLVERKEAPGWYRWGLFGVLALAWFFDFFHLGDYGYSNFFYASAVRSMLMSWHNFWYLAFDAAGFLSIDKPPLGFWLQTASAWLFGMSPWSVLLPQALAGVLSIALLAHLLRRYFGPVAALSAALTLALSPINIATNRSNNVDSLLVLSGLLAVWAILLAVEKGKLKWLLLSAFLLGLGFNIKSLEAFLVLPALAAYYFFASRHKWGKRVLHLGLASLLLIVVSLAWMISVDLTPASARPYISSSGNNSEISLAIGYNGLSRLLPHEAAVNESSPSYLALSPPQRQLFKEYTQAITEAYNQEVSAMQASGMVMGETGLASPVRLINPQVGSQISWLLGLVLFGLVILAIKWKPYFSQLSEQRAQWWLWGTWFLTQAGVFSLANYFHLYYLAVCMPSLCALVGIGIGLLSESYAKQQARSWLLLLALGLSGLIQLQLLSYFPNWQPWLLWAMLAGLGLAALIILLTFINRRRKSTIARTQLRSKAGLRMSSIQLATSIGLLALLLAPTAWSLETLSARHNSDFPIAGPTLGSEYIPDLDLTQFMPDASTLKILEDQGNPRFLAATPDVFTAAPLILATGKPIMAIGGYVGGSHITTLEQVQAMVRRGDVRYFVMFAHKAILQLPPLPPTASLSQLYESFDSFSEDVTVRRVNVWVMETCQPKWQGTWKAVGNSQHTLPETVFDCAQASTSSADSRRKDQ
ncbi:glycosyltransferase family 39 protein [Ktedonosporobacter rubrisoli]|uniref:Glycosyltransferase family 39 protein n=1 Tax=Ktedonosporobacter rubrisoli TaxID=2509675 RepID=A0A4P6JK68_KTERU|nr:glycosyltransferase family 39 protein [Ktedonosporobacter rubrisoli]QBD75360.1 glycosyltransferase family 39 protein [Ktedonosporobacter rubrisoli]